jgi:transcriptional regulator GlxA family with amidase domain
MMASPFVPKGVTNLVVDFDGTTKDFYFLLLPNTTMLAFSAAVDPLRVTNQVSGRELYRWYVLSEDGAPVRCSNGIRIVADGPLKDIPKSATLFVIAGTEPNAAVSNRVVQWIRRQRTFGCKLGGICTGAFALAKAGLLENRRFTLHWENQQTFRETFMGLEPTGNLYESDGQIVTCGGGTAATDMILESIERDHGKDLATVVADMCIHTRSNDRRAPQVSAYSVALNVRNAKLTRAILYMGDNIEDPVDMPEIANHVQLSRRQLERLFAKYLGKTPMRLYLEMRLARAHALLNETQMSVSEIAVASGFGTVTQLAAAFKKKYGMTPSGYRKSWLA